MNPLSALKTTKSEPNGTCFGRSSETTMAGSNDNPSDLVLPNGTTIVTKGKKKLEIIELLQKSTLRSCYVAKMPNVDGKFVIKVEQPQALPTGIKLERNVAAVIGMATPLEAERFAEYVEYGESKVINFVIWKRLGPSLDELHQMYRQRFSLSTAARINVQTLRAIWKLHALNFVHRNIQPAHFVVGENAKRVIYIISFSLVRHYKPNPDGADGKTRLKQSTNNGAESCPPSTMGRALARESTTVQRYFAPRIWYTHDSGVHSCRLDDLESWFFMSLHFVNPDCIPWAKIPPQMLTDVYEVKRDIFSHQYTEKIFLPNGTIPRAYRRLIDEINANTPTAMPDYDKFLLIANSVVKEACPTANTPYDWEEIAAPLLSDYGEFRVPAVISPAVGSRKSGNSTNTANEILEDPEMDRLVEHWQNNFRKLVLSGVPRAEAYRRVMGIKHPAELASGHWNPSNEKKKPEKTNPTSSTTTNDPTL
uniref:Protein kinase domain-containing protein n=1 Tax=Panagrellus redivivus TaxID=6233 RepID=A0A7E4UW78_PANRE